MSDHENTPTRPEQIQTIKDVERYTKKVFTTALEEREQELKQLESENHRNNELRECMRTQIDSDIVYTSNQEASDVLYYISKYDDKVIPRSEEMEDTTKLYLALKRICLSYLNEFNWEFWEATLSPLMKANGTEIRFNENITLQKMEWPHPEHTEFKVFFNGKKVESYTIGGRNSTGMNALKVQQKLTELEEKQLEKQENSSEVMA